MELDIGNPGIDNENPEGDGEDQGAGEEDHSAYHHVNRSDDGRDRKRIDLRVPAVDLLSFEVKRVKYLDDQGQIFSANFLDKSGRGYSLYGICP